MGEIQGRCTGDIGEMYGRYRGDIGEICTLIGRLVVTMASPESASCAALKGLGIGLGLGVGSWLGLTPTLGLTISLALTLSLTPNPNLEVAQVALGRAELARGDPRHTW